MLNRKWLPYIVILLLGIALFAIRRCGTNGTTDPSLPRKQHTDQVDRDRGFDRRVSLLEYSRHARCRMQCRRISESEVEEIMRSGTINYRKSDLQNARCPRYALEGDTRDDQRVRIIFAQCNEKTEVVTVIDLGTDWECDCPGDDAKYKNKR